MASQPILETVEILSTKPLNELLSEVTIKVCYVSETPNRNGTVINEEIGREIAATLPGAPIVGYYKEDDFQEHSQRIIFTGNELLLEDLTRPYGFVSPDTQPWYQVFVEDGIPRKWLMCTGYLWTKQYLEANQIIGEGQSMELDENDMDGYWEGDKFVFTHAAASKLCILGSQFEPCFEGAGFMAKYMKQNDDFVTQLENILGRRYCVVDGKLTVKEELDKEKDATIPTTSYSLETETPPITYAESGSTSGESSTGETSTEGTDSSETTGTDTTPTVGGETGKSSSEGSETTEPDNPELPIDPVEPPKEDEDEDETGEGEDGEDGEQTTEEPGEDEEEEPEITPTRTVKGDTSVAKSLTAEAQRATTKAEGEKKKFENAVDGIIDEVKPESTTPNVETKTNEYALSDPEPSQIPDGSVVTPGSQEATIPSGADSISVAVKTTGPELPPTPDIPEGTLDEAKLRRMIEAAVRTLTASASASAAEGAFKNDVAGVVQAVGAKEPVEGPTLAEQAQEQQKDLVISEQKKTIEDLQAKVAELEQQVKDLLAELEDYRQKEAAAQEAKRQALIDDYMSLLGEEGMAEIANQYKNMNYEDTENLLALTYARKQRNNMKNQQNINGVQLDIGSLGLGVSGNDELPHFMKQAMEIEGQI